MAPAVFTVKTLAEGQHPAHMTEDEAIVYDFCTELLENKRVSDVPYSVQSRSVVKKASCRRP